MNLLGIDYGLKHVGIALSTDGWVEPLAVLTNDLHLVSRIIAFVDQHSVDLLIIGLPDGPLVGPVQQFKLQLTGKISAPIELYDETLTSHEAVVKMNQAGKSLKSKRNNQDAVAAAVLLQNYLAAKEGNV